MKRSTAQRGVAKINCLISFLVPPVRNVVNSRSKCHKKWQNVVEEWLIGNHFPFVIPFRVGAASKSLYDRRRMSSNNCLRGLSLFPSLPSDSRCPRCFVTFAICSSFKKPNRQYLIRKRCNRVDIAGESFKWWWSREEIKGRLLQNLNWWRAESRTKIIPRDIGICQGRNVRLMTD